MVLTYASSLQGNDGFLLDLFGLRQTFYKGNHDLTDSHVAAPLLARIKGKDGERYHMLLMVSTTASGIQVRQWLECLVLVKERKGRLHGAAFCNKNGNVHQTLEYEEDFLCGTP